MARGLASRIVFNTSPQPLATKPTVIHSVFIYHYYSSLAIVNVLQVLQIYHLPVIYPPVNCLRFSEAMYWQCSGE